MGAEPVDLRPICRQESTQTAQRSQATTIQALHSFSTFYQYNNLCFCAINTAATSTLPSYMAFLIYREVGIRNLGQSHIRRIGTLQSPGRHAIEKRLQGIDKRLGEVLVSVNHIRSKYQTVNEYTISVLIGSIEMTVVSQPRACIQVLRQFSSALAGILRAVDARAG